MNNPTQTNETLMSLAVRVEEATGADESLDVEIVYALHPDIGPYQGMCVGDEPIFWHDPYRKQPCPQFTASLDAAMTLVPEGWLTWGVRQAANGWSWDLIFYRASEACGFVKAEGLTAALALTAAALKARAHSGERE